MTTEEIEWHGYRARVWAWSPAPVQWIVPEPPPPPPPPIPPGTRCAGFDDEAGWWYYRVDQVTVDGHATVRPWLVEADGTPRNSQHIRPMIELVDDEPRGVDIYCSDPPSEAELDHWVRTGQFQPAIAAPAGTWAPPA